MFKLQYCDVIDYLSHFLGVPRSRLVRSLLFSRPVYFALFSSHFEVFQLLLYFWEFLVIVILKLDRTRLRV